MKKLYSLLTLICSLGFGQTILNQPENSSRTVEDPNTIILTNGFHAKGNNVFVARIGENVQSSPSPSDSNSGISNPSGTIGTNNFHDTQGNIEVTASGQLQYTLPIALPPGVKSVAPQINLVYTSGSGNGIAGYGWNLSGITAISRMGKTIEKDGRVEGIKLNYDDYYSFNGQRLILKSGEYGKNGAEYTTEKYSNVKIKSLGNINGYFQGPEYWEVTFEDGSQAWYGTTSSARTPIEYNIVKWKDAQGNYITYNYTQSNNVAAISSIEWGGNETLNKPHFNRILFSYQTREIKETSYVEGIYFLQDKLLSSVQVLTNGKQFKKYTISYNNSTGSKYQFVRNITEYNSANEAANPINFGYEGVSFTSKTSNFTDNENNKIVGDFNGDGKLDFIKYFDTFKECIDRSEETICEDRGYEIPCYTQTNCISEVTYPEGLYLFESMMDDNFNKKQIHIGTSDFSKTDFNTTAIPITLRTKEGILKQQQGFVLYKKTSNSVTGKDDLEIQIYSIDSNDYRVTKEYSKIIPNSIYDRTVGSAISSDYYTETSIGKIRSVDLNSDGLAEIIISANDFTCVKQRDGSDMIQEYYIERIPDTSCSNSNRYLVLEPFNNDINVSTISLYPYDKDIIDSYKTGDFNGDGKLDFLRFDSNKQPFITNINKNLDTGQFVDNHLSYGNTKLEGLVENAITGDFNGDGKTDLLIPQEKNNYKWNLYISKGNGFLKQSIDNLSYYRPDADHYEESGRYYYYGRNYLVQDINQDGKDDFIEIGVHSRQNRYPSNNFANFIVNLFENNGPNANGNISFSKKNIDGHSESVSSVPKVFTPYSLANYTNYPFIYSKGDGYLYTNAPNPSSHRGTPHSFQIFSPMVGNYLINNNYNQLILTIRGLLFKYSTESLNKAAHITSITQGGVTTTIDYKELDPKVNPNFYAPVKKETYPFVEMDRVAQSYAVAQLQQTFDNGGKNIIRKQDFRYRGLLSHLQGRGMIGFRQTARSSWYTDEFRNTIVWSGAEIDPHQEGVPIKEWSIKTTNEAEIFPSDLSFSNRKLLALKTTEYRTDLLADGAKVDAITDTNRNRIVKALVPVRNTSKDFIKDVTTKSTITYDNFYLPTRTITQTLSGSSVFATSTTSLEYLPPNLSATGKDYHVGRPRSKTELMQAYGDSKGAKEEYTYENNLLKTLKTWNRDSSGWLQETYNYDGFGNIIQKTVTNSVDSHTQNSKTEYESKGRFVVKKTDNLGLVTHITYNDWGQVLTQTDPLGNKITNTYDAWGKLLTAKTNLGGVSTYTYEKLGNGDTKTTEYSPDGSVSISFTNKIGQTYKSTSKAFGNQWVSKSVMFDGLGRKIKESEPYFDHQNPTQWNTIEYDVYSRPIKATAFTGKIVTTQYTQNTVTTTETNANNRFKKQTFDALGNISTSADKGGTITFKYNAAGEQIEAKYGTNTVTTKYDAWGRKIEFNDPSNGIYRYEYNGFGQNTKTISPKGTKTYTYNTKGQLVSQRELSTDNTNATDKSISYTYNAKGLVVKKAGVSKGKTYTSSLVYDGFGRVLSSSEENNGRYFMQKDIVYDDKNRVISYEKSLYSGGTYTKALIENIYDPWSGALYQLKDKVSGKVLWQLQQHNAKGQVTQAKLGASTIENTYDTNGFLTNINHSSARKPSILQISYRFDAIKNELNSRTTGGDFNILESFTYDENNRLTNWTNPVTGQMHHNIYDAQGRIIENDQLGKISFGNSQKIYQPTAVTLNATGEQNLKNDLVQQISYNENNDPLLIQGVKGDLRFEYGLSSMRQVMSFGGKIASGSHGKFTRYYSEDGSYEITLDHATGREKHTLYIGGTPYESDIIYLKNYTESQASYKFLHKDYLGSILAISDEAGNKLEQHHYDAWGNLTHLKIGEQATITDKNQIKDYLASSNLITDRGYTSHEHLAEVGLIHMNGRLYDPLLRRFLNADENIQDGFNTQNYNKYGYVLNNPLMYNDPSGEIFFFAILTPILGEVLAGVVAGAIAGAIVGATSYVLSAVISSNWNWGGFAKSILMGAISGAISGGMNPGIFSSAAGTLYRMGGQAISSILPSWNISIGNFDFNFSPSIAIGKGWGFGANISATFRSGDFAISAGIGIMNYGAHQGSGKSGWEYRKSLMAGFEGKNGNLGFMLGTNMWKGLHQQQTGIVRFQSGDFSLSYENDGAPFGHTLGDNHDRLRTAAVNLTIGEFSAGFNLFTGERFESSYYDNKTSYNSSDILSDVIPHDYWQMSKSSIGEYGEKYKFGIVKEVGKQYRLGAAYVGWGNYRIGIDSDRHVRHAIQNRLAHTFLSPQPGFRVLSNAINPYFQYRTRNQFTSW
ncbi:polymorphic toxin type 23 domain-containing protein [Riemerella anatipestifer]|nr:polymorphic toxin type 23 domain-containing protein [Riemerella anatipestifer]